MKHFSILTLILLGITFGVQAQTPAETIEYGDILTAEFTADTALTFEFEGERGDLVVIEARGVEQFGVSPRISLLLDNQAVGSAERIIGLYGPNALALAELPENATYTVSITPDDTGKPRGEFTLKLDTVEILTEEPLSGTINDDTLDAYYAVTGEDDFTVRFERTDGDYSPGLTIYNLAEDWQPVAELQGSLIAGALSIVGDENAVYLVAVNAYTGDYYVGGVAADFEIFLAD